MQIDRILNDAASSAVVKNLATAFGVDPVRATPAIEFMFQALTDRIERNTLSRGGVADVVDLLGKSNIGRAPKRSRLLRRLFIFFTRFWTINLLVKIVSKIK